MNPTLNDIHDFVTDLGGVTDDTLARFGFDRITRALIVRDMEPIWYEQLRKHLP